MFFKYYIQIGEELVFKYINQYFTAVEINKYGTLYFYKLLWLYKNVTLASILREVVRDN
jgi:hypothetical protein